MKALVLGLTLFRIFSGPILFLLVIFFQANLIAFFIFVIASITDYLDGKLARDYKVESLLGAILDPIADKILVLFALFAITFATKDPFVGSMSTLILAREFWVSALREYAAQHSLSYATKVTFLAKTKTSIQFLALALFFLGFSLDNALMIFLASFILFLALLISMKTAIDYSAKVFKL